MNAGSSNNQRKPIEQWGDTTIRPGESKDVMLAVGESYSSITLQIPIHVRRALEPGPVVFVTAALHGDEINGTGAIRQLVQEEDFQPMRGSLILVPVLNISAFDRHSRYMPDRRDLNRCFPGTATGSLAGRMARTLFDEIVLRSDYGIDLHTASVRRTNYPNVRGDLSDPGVHRLATAFGCEVIINGKGPAGSFRREATRAGCPTIVVEGGEVWKVEPGIVQSMTRGIKNALRNLEMLDGDLQTPDYQVQVNSSKWIRAERGGFLQFHVKPGDIIEKGHALVTNTNLLGKEHSMLHSPFDGVVIGMTTLPAITPGEPVCNIGKLPKGTKPSELRRLRKEETVVEELASNVLVVEPRENLQ